MVHLLAQKLYDLNQMVWDLYKNIINVTEHLFKKLSCAFFSRAKPILEWKRTVFSFFVLTMFVVLGFCSTAKLWHCSSLKHKEMSIDFVIVIFS